MVELFSVLLIIGYLGFIKWIAARSHCQSKNTPEDFFLVNRSLSGSLLWMTILATIINSLAFTAVPGLIYKGGILFLQMWVIVLVVPSFMRIFGPRVSSYARTHNIFSQGELFGTYYNSRSLSLCTGIIAILAVLPFMTIQLSAIAKVVSVTTAGSIAYTPAILIFSISTGLYIYFGGARAVVKTDFFQGGCFFLLLLASAILFSYWVGGYREAVQKISLTRPDLFSFHEGNWKIFIDNILSWPFAFFLWPQLFQRLFMARSEKEIKRSSVATLILFSCTMFLIMTIGLMATARFIGTEINPDILIAEMYRQYLPIGGAFIVLAVVASGMSTLDSGLLSLTAVVLRDFKKAQADISQKTQQYMRGISLCLLIIVTVFALSETGRGAIAPLVTLGASFATLFFWPLLGMTYLKGVTSTTIFISYLSGILGILSAAVFDLYYGPGTFGFCCGAGGFFISYISSSVSQSASNIAS